ncbi:MAG: LysR family transcriptional regulator [Desulfobacteraceae bacterium]|jgi:DNA-binding transcriptional LysR family regulator
MQITFDQLNAFRILAETKSFTKTAERLFRTQPAISQMIASLEDGIGEKLFIRQGRAVILTQAGDILLEHSNDAFRIVEQGLYRIDALKELKQGKLTISTSDTTAYYILPEVLKKFRVKYPGIDVRIFCKPSPVSAAQVLSGEADIGIVTLPVEDTRLSSEPLVIREDVAICSTGHLLSKRKKILFRDLTDYPLLLLDRGSSTRSYIDERFVREGIKPKIIMELGNIEVIKKLVQLEFGISIVPLISVQSEIKDNRLNVIHVFKKNECRKLGLIYQAKGIYSIAAMEFSNMLKLYLTDKNRL